MGQPFRPTDRREKILMAAGGTGGHLFPALTLAREIKKMRPDSEIAFVISGRPLEKKILGAEGFELFILASSGFKRAGFAGKAKAALLAARGVWEARRLIKTFRPVLCFGAGGYVSGPVGLAARLCGVDLAIHEANARPGLTNKILGRLARVVMVGFEEAQPFFKKSKVRLTGNPVRGEIAALNERVKNFDGKPAILITGGSQGASAVNRAALSALLNLKEEGFEFTAFHQSGADDWAELEKAYREGGVEATVAPFFEDMPRIYEKAHLVISRGGAGTISELAAARAPSIIIPLPTAADDHQTANAKSLADRGAALLIPQRELSGPRLATELKGLLALPRRLESMSQAAGRAATIGAEKKMAALCLELMETRK